MVRRFLTALKYFFSFEWIPRFYIDCIPPKFLLIDGKKIDLSNFTELKVCGDGLAKWNVCDGKKIYVEVFKEQNDCYNIKKRPVVVINDEDERYFFESKFSLKKFISYFDLRPESAEITINDINKKKEENDSSVIVCDSMPLDVYKWTEFYHTHKEMLDDLSMFAWQQMCLVAEKKYLCTGKKKELDYHRMAIVAVKYGIQPTTYRIIPAEKIVAIAKYMI